MCLEILEFHLYFSSSSESARSLEAHMGGGKEGSSLAVPAVNILTMMHKSWTADTGHSAPNARQTVGKMNVDSRMKSGSEFHIQTRILGQDTQPIPRALPVIVLLFPSC